MTYRERMLAVLAGRPTDCIPFVPRLDVWYQANKDHGTLPDKYKNATLLQIVEDLDIGYHTGVADHVYNDSLDIVDQALGILRGPYKPHRSCLRNINRNISYQGDTITVEYLTPHGTIRTKVEYDQARRKTGTLSPQVSEHAIKSVADFAAVGYIFENMDVYPDYEGLEKLKTEIGDRGLVVSTGQMGISAMHHILSTLISYDIFLCEYYDNYDMLEQLAASLTPYVNRVIDIAANSPADIIQSGINYDTSITWSPFLEKHLMPYLAGTAEKIHANGKFLLSGSVSETKGLCTHYQQGHLDIADSVCPAPMTSLSLQEIRQALDAKITIWGGIPSVTVLEDCMSDYEFDTYLDQLFMQVGKGDHLILSIAAAAPPQMKFSRLERITKLAKEFGPVNP